MGRARERSGPDMGSVDVSPKAAAKRGVEVIPLDWYSRGRLTREGLQLCFAALDAREIRRGVQELAIALQDFRASS